MSEARFDLGDAEEFEFTKVEGTTDGNVRLLVRYKKKRRSEEKDLGWFLKLSEDGGKTFGKEYKTTEIIKSDEEFASYIFHFVPNGFAATIGRGKNFFYAQSRGNLENWSKPIQVNDEQDSVRGGFQVLQTSENEVFCVWMDTRRGFNLTFFSSSNDGGKTWSANQPIDYDFREGSQEYGQIVLGKNGRLHVFWQDFRDRKTLVDIRYSYSDDKGINWSESTKINDDEKEVWQIYPRVVADGAHVYVAFTDFREKGEEGDNDWNIYFARSTDNGATWDKNKRLNDIKEGVDWFPALSIDEEGILYCAWEAGRETLFGQIVFSYSKDKGETWSPSIPTSSKDGLAIGGYTTIDFISPTKLLMRQGREKFGKLDIYYSYLEKTDELIDSKTEQNIETEKKFIDPIKYEFGEILFEDRFSNETAEKWEVKSGVWDIVGGTYMGVYPNQSKRFVSYAKFQEPEKYLLQGRFRLDAVAHTSAMLLFRADQEGEKQYAITNRFRVGAWLSIDESEFPDLLEADNLVGGKPLSQKSYPFRQDRWYKFTLVVTPEQVDYYVEGRLMLSYKGELILPRGKIGIGGHTSSPTYFDDIKVSELKE